MSVIDNYTVIKVAPHCSIEIIFLYLQSMFWHTWFFMCLLKFHFSVHKHTSAFYWHIKTCF